MITVIGMWEKDWMDAERAERRIWKQTLQSFEVDRWIMAPANEYVFTSPKQFETVEEAINSVEGKKTFCIPPGRVENSLNLTEYRHPDNSIYVLGCAGNNLTKYLTKNDDVVSIYTPTVASMFGCAAIAAILYDRLRKQG